MKRFSTLTLLALFLLSSESYCQSTLKSNQSFEYEQGAIVRADKEHKEIALVFTGGSYADGLQQITSVLKKQKVKASFFFTGEFYDSYHKLIKVLVKDGHYVGGHSDKHLLYCDWVKRDSLLVTKEEFSKDLNDNYEKMRLLNIPKENAKYYLPAFEWYNDSISAWTKDLGLQLVNMTKGTISHADYTTPEMKNYRSSDDIYKNVIDYEKNSKFGLNGFLLLIHVGTHPDRTDKFYNRLVSLIIELKTKGYTFKRINELLD